MREFDYIPPHLTFSCESCQRQISAYEKVPGRYRPFTKLKCPCGAQIDGVIQGYDKDGIWTLMHDKTITDWLNELKAKRVAVKAARPTDPVELARLARLRAERRAQKKRREEELREEEERERREFFEWYRQEEEKRRTLDVAEQIAKQKEKERIAVEARINARPQPYAAQSEVARVIRHDLMEAEFERRLFA